MSAELIHYCESCAGECERVVHLKYERTGLIVEMEILAENDRLTAQRDALYASLKRFAGAMPSFPDEPAGPKNGLAISENSIGTILVADVRRAHAALSLVNQEKA